MYKLDDIFTRRFIQPACVAIIIALVFAVILGTIEHTSRIYFGSDKIAIAIGMIIMGRKWRAEIAKDALKVASETEIDKGMSK